MTALYIIAFLIACIGIVLALGITPERVGEDMKRFFDKQQTMQDMAKEAQGKKKPNKLMVEMIRIRKVLEETNMDMHGQVLAAVWERNIKLLTIIANLLKPVALGLLYLYGVQSVATTPEEAKAIADKDFVGLCSVLQGTYRVLEHRALTYDELEWLHEKMYTMDRLTVVRGIPKAKSGGVDVGDKGMGGKNVNADSQDTTEEYISGMSDREYVLQIISSPVKAEHLERWLGQTAREMTRWYKQLQGSTSMNFSLSIPMMYMANLGASEGWNHSYTEADSVTDTVP